MVDGPARHAKVVQILCGCGGGVSVVCHCEQSEAISMSSNNPIGIFDSGVGGLSVLREIRAQMPNEHLIYFGDQGHVPYGPRSMEQIQGFSEGITKFLLKHNSKIIVVACNTASAAALKHLRATFP